MKKIELLFELMEYHKIYLYSGLTPRKVAKILNCNYQEIERALYIALGINLADIITLYRVQHSRGLLIKGVDFHDISALSGFRSKLRLISSFKAIVQ